MVKKQIIFFGSATCIILIAVVFCILNIYFPVNKDLILAIGFSGILANLIQIYSFYSQTIESSTHEKKLAELHKELQDVLVQKMDKHELVQYIIDKIEKKK